MTVDIYEPAGVIADLPTDDARFKLGQRAKGEHNTEWLYVQASGAITQYDLVAIDEDYTARACSASEAAAGHTPGFAQIAFSDNEFGWVAVKGSNINVRAAASAAADSKLWAGAVASAGVVDDASASGSTVLEGVVLVTTQNTGTGANEIIASNPHFLV